MSRIQSGKMAMDFSETDLAEVAAHAVEGARPHAQDKHITLALHAVATPRLTCDPARIGQLLDNLIANALKFTPEGGRVEVRAGPDGDGAILAVADSGIGIPAADRERIFERFFRSDIANQQAFPGTGLGLTIVHAIIANHGGELSLRSREGEGTTVVARIPLLTAGGVTAVPRPPASRDGPSPPSGGDLTHRS